MNMHVDPMLMALVKHHSPRRPRPTVCQIALVVTEYYRLRKDDLFVRGRRSDSWRVQRLKIRMGIKRIRQIAMYLSYDPPRVSYRMVGRVFGCVDHTGPLHAREVIRDLIDTDPRIAADVVAIKRLLKDRYR